VAHLHADYSALFGVLVRNESPDRWVARLCFGGIGAKAAWTGELGRCLERQSRSSL